MAYYEVSASIQYIKVISVEIILGTREILIIIIIIIILWELINDWIFILLSSIPNVGHHSELHVYGYPVFGTQFMVRLGVSSLSVFLQYSLLRCSFPPLANLCFHSFWRIHRSTCTEYLAICLFMPTIYTLLIPVCVCVCVCVCLSYTHWCSLNETLYLNCIIFSKSDAYLELCCSV